jgi:hypothetical protein
MTARVFVKILVAFVLLFLVLDTLIATGLEKGLYRYYGIGQTTDIALIGHSHLMLGIDKIELEEALKTRVAKYTREGVNVADRHQMIKQLLSKNPGLNTVIYGVDAWTFTGEGLSENSHKLFYPFLDDPDIDSYVRNQDPLLEYLPKKYIKTSRYNELLIAGAMRGYFGVWDNLKYGTVDTLKLEQEISRGNYRQINNTIENIELFKASVQLLTERGIHVILLHVPTIDKLETIQQREFDETIAIFKSLESENVTFLNFQEPWSHQYEIFYDPIHLNPKGQKQITSQLIRALKQRDF